MRWYQTPKGKRRFKVEVKQMNRRVPHFSLYQDDRNGDLMWRGGVVVQGHKHRDVRLVYNKRHPFKKMDVFIFKPRLPIGYSMHIHDDGSICYINEYTEWNPNWTAFTVYLTTVRFLDDYYRGKM